jgi:hypothetical protein
MAARGIRDQRMGGVPGHPIQVSKPPQLGRPVMTKSPMVRPLKPAHLKQPSLGIAAPQVASPAGMPPNLQGPTQVNPAGPMLTQPLTA